MNAFTPVPKTEDATLTDAGAAMNQAIQRLIAAKNRSTAEVLQELRRAFPHSPLAVRVRALEALRRR